MKKVLITGASGQDAIYLAKFLLDRGCELHLQSRSIKSSIIAHPNSYSYVVDLKKPLELENLCLKILPDEIYNLAAQSQPQASWEEPFDACLINAMVPHRLLEFIRNHLPRCKLYQASSSEIFGNTRVSPQDELTSFLPATPYAVAKTYAHQIAGVYRAKYDLYACSGILFHHESPYRPLHFVTQKIAHSAALVAEGITYSKETNEQGEPLLSDGKVALGNLEVLRDFGFSGDYVEAMWLMLQQEKPEDFVIGTGEAHSIKEICEIAFGYVGKDWTRHVRIDPRFIRASETRSTVANAEKAHRILGWKPKVRFQDLIEMMVQARMKNIRQTYR